MMKQIQVWVTAGILFFLMLAGLPGAEAASGYPSKVITWHAPYGAGGGTDRWSRIMSSVAFDHFGQPWRVVNMVGAQGIVGWKHLLKQPADGHTIIFASPTAVISLVSEDKPPISPHDIKIVAFVSAFRPLLVTKKNKPWSTWEGLKKYAKENPGKFTVGGSLSNLMAMSNLFGQAGIKATLVTYPGAGRAATDFLGGHVQAIGVTTSTAVGLIPERGVVVVNSSTTPTTHKKLKGVPSAKDLGYEGLTFPRWVGVHPNTPDEIADQISIRLGKVLKSKSVSKLIKKIGEDIIFVPRKEAAVQYRKMVELMAKTVKAMK